MPEARREAGSLLSFVLRRDRTFLISHAEHQLSNDSLDEFRTGVERRASGEPLQYITGVQDFSDAVSRNSDVLIPRPETELLVEAALEVANSLSPIVCDVGTGSGCIAITLLCEIGDAQAVALDNSASALEIAKVNANNLSVSNQTTFWFRIASTRWIRACIGLTWLSQIRRMSQAP